jgi:hypothetical protein
MPAAKETPPQEIMIISDLGPITGREHRISQHVLFSSLFMASVAFKDGKSRLSWHVKTVLLG